MPLHEQRACKARSTHTSRSIGCIMSVRSTRRRARSAPASRGEPALDSPQAEEIAPASRDEPALDSEQAEEIDDILNGRFRVRWQVYLQEWDVWKQYTAVQSSSIEAAWQAEATELDIGSEEDDEELWAINLISLTQTNRYSGTSRPIQRVVVTHR